MRAVLSTYASPSLSVCVPVGLIILNALYFVATDQRIVSRIAVQMAGAAQLHCPTPKTWHRVVVMYVLADSPYAVLIL